MSVRCDNRGRWYYRKWVQAPDGRRQRICGYPATNTKKAAEHAERVHVLKIENPLAVPVAPTTTKEVITIAEYCETFLAGYAGSHKPSELASKKRILSAHILPWFGDISIDAVLQSDVDAFVADLIGGGRTRKTVNNITSVLSSLLRYAAKNRLRPPVDLAFAIREDESELVALSADEVTKLVAAADARYAVAILLAADAGLRVGEVRGLKWSDVNELARTISISRSIDPANHLTSPKSRKRRTVPMTDRLRLALKEAASGSFVVSRLDGRPLGYYAMRERLRSIYDEAGVTIPPKPWHCLRHTFCTELARGGTPVHVIKELAGHASVQTTLRYMHTSEADRRLAIASLGESNGQHMGSKPRSNDSQKPKT